MRRVLGIAAAILAAAFGSDCVNEARADGPQRDNFLIFSGADLWREGSSLHGGVLWAPGGLDRDGIVFKLSLGGATYTYLSGALGGAEVRGREVSATFQPGWRFTRPGLTVTGFAGIQVQSDSLSPDDPTSKLRGSAVGFRGGIEFWYEPTSATMISLDASGSNIGPSYSARGALGLRILERFYFGPEVQGFAFDDNYKQVRAGLHVTALKTGMLEWSAAAGWALDSDGRDGIYGRLGLLMRR